MPHLPPAPSLKATRDRGPRPTPCGRAKRRSPSGPVWPPRTIAGWDPYDALNARRLPAAVKTSRSVPARLTQAVKRSPLPLQPLLGVKREADAYTLGHVLLAAARLSADSGPSDDVAAPAGARAARATPDVASTCERVLARLRSMANVDGERMAWGYHFPVHTRFFSYVPPTPNLIVTAFVAKGMAAVTRAGLADCTAEIRGAVAFVLGGLPRVTDETGQCIGYVPDDAAVVHNANMLAALVLCEAAEIVGVPADPGGAASGGAPPSDDTAAWIDEALACARYTVARQAADGSWPYSEESYGRWVDGFHTGFVLEGLSPSGARHGRRGTQRGTRSAASATTSPSSSDPTASPSTTPARPIRTTPYRPPRAWRRFTSPSAGMPRRRSPDSWTGSAITSSRPMAGWPTRCTSAGPTGASSPAGRALP